MNYIGVPLYKNHQKRLFDCGNAVLNTYLHKQAGQDMRRKLAVCFVLEGDENIVKGYYTLSNASIPKSIVPETLRKRMPPSYDNLPVTLLGRLAINQSFRRMGLGGLLLMDALKRSYEVAIHSIGSVAVVVDSINENAISFYEKYGFLSLDESQRMFLPMATIKQLFRK